jgi:hypothetical protein
MSIEELLARDIAAVTGGVVVTDSELLEARKAVNERIQRSRIGVGTIAAAAAAVAVLVAAGVGAFLMLGDDNQASQPATGPDDSDPDTAFLTGAAPTSQLIKGVWRVDNGKILLKLGADGSVRFDDQGTLFSHPATTGTYAIDGNVITVTTTQSAQQSCVGTTYAMRASLPKVGALRFISSQATASACSPLPVGRGELERVLPTAASLAELVRSTDPGWKPLSGKGTLYGIWLAERGGHVLEMDPDGAYFIADESGDPIDRGAWSLRGADLTLTSSAGSVKCNPGDRLVLGSLEQIDPDTTSIRGTVRQNACGGAWTPATWILFPNASG